LTFTPFITTQLLRRTPLPITQPSPMLTSGPGNGSNSTDSSHNGDYASSVQMASMVFVGHQRAYTPIASSMQIRRHARLLLPLLLNNCALPLQCCVLQPCLTSHL
jgi:hypothetical protein